MTETLVERLRSRLMTDLGLSVLGEDAADYIEELERQVKYWSTKADKETSRVAELESQLAIARQQERERCAKKLEGAAAVWRSMSPVQFPFAIKIRAEECEGQARNLRALPDEEGK